MLRNRSFMQLLCGRLAATFATQIQSIVVAWQVYAITHNPLTLGYVGLAQFLPMAALTLPAGDLADRFERRRLLALSWLLQAGASALFLFLTLGHSATVRRPFYGVLVLFGLARALAGPAMQSFLPLLVPERQLGNAIAWSSSAFQVAIIAGPALGGALYIIGPSIAYGLCLVLFASSAIAVSTIRHVHIHQTPSQRQPALARFTAGIAYIRSRPVILGAISLDLFAVLFGGATALLPVYAHLLHVGPGGLGVLRSAIAMGAFATGVHLGRRSLRHHAGRTLFASVALFGAATVVFGLSRNFPLSVAALLVVGAADMVSMYVRSTLVQITTPDAMRGRVSAVNMLFIGASNELGEFESGVTAAWFGTVPAVVIGGAGTLAVVALWMWLFPDLRRVARVSADKPA